jgi:TPR repeat protein
MSGPSALCGKVVKSLVCALSLAVAGCAELGDAWQKAGQEMEALFESPPPGPTDEERERAKVAYDRALKARAAGDSQAAANHFRDAAELGDAGAAYELGLAYIAGDGVPENHELSAQWINRAADLGDPGAQFLVGSSFYGGIGVEQDIPRALSFLQRAAVQGHPKAQFLLGQAYVDGVGVPENAEWAARWYGKAARGGDPQAQYALGVMFASGFGVPESARRSYQWFSIAAGNGYQKAAAFRDQMGKRLTPAARTRADATIAHFSAEVTSGYADAPTVMYVQLRLRALGYNPGPADGIAGSKTRAAIEAFQTSERVTVDGELSRGLVENLFARDTPRGA